MLALQPHTQRNPLFFPSPRFIEVCGALRSPPRCLHTEECVLALLCVVASGELGFAKENRSVIMHALQYTRSALGLVGTHLCFLKMLQKYVTRALTCFFSPQIARQQQQLLQQQHKINLLQQQIQVRLYVYARVHSY